MVDAVYPAGALWLPVAQGPLLVVGVVPRAFSSSVQKCSSSWISSGSTKVLVQASSHVGFEGSALARSLAAPFLFLESLPFRREKMPGIVGDRDAKDNM